MADGVTVKLEGVDALNKALAEATKQIRTKAVRSALRKAAVVIQKQAKLNTPVLSAPTKTRKPGTVKNAITVRVSKAARKDGNEGVFVSVRPLKSAQIRKFKQSQAKRGANASGSKNPNDPFYWWWVEFGHKIVRRNGEAGYGETTYQQRLRDGRIVTRTKKYNKQSITGRRRGQVGFVEGRKFMTRAADSKGNEAIKTFMDSVIPQIEKLNAKAKR